jgi:hypothetical protein
MANKERFNWMEWNQLLNPPKGVRTMSLLAGLAAGEACSLYAIFVAHTMSPVSYRMVAADLKLSAIYGRYQELYDFNGLTLTLVASCVAFSIAWVAVRGIAAALAEQPTGAGRVAFPLSRAVGEGDRANLPA